MKRNDKFGSHREKRTSAPQSPFPTSDSESIQLETPLEMHIRQVVRYEKDVHSSQFIVSNISFQRYISSEYQKLSTSNEQEAFNNNLFLSINLPSLRNDAAAHILLLSSVLDVDLGNKVDKAKRVLRNLLCLAPHTSPDVWNAFERICIWLQSPLVNSIQITIQPIKDYIYSWSKKDNKTSVMSSLYLLDAFIRIFPFINITDFDNISTLLIKNLKHESEEIAMKAAHVVGSLIVQNQSIPVLLEQLQSNLNFILNDKNNITPNQVKALSYIVHHYPQLKYSIFEPVKYLSPQKIFLYELVPLALYCSPQSFNAQSYKAIIGIFDMFSEKGKADPQPNDPRFKVIGDTLFMLPEESVADQAKTLASIYSNSMGVDTDEAIYAALATAPLELETIKQKGHADTAIELAIKRTLSPVLADGLKNYLKKYPESLYLIKPYVLQYCRDQIQNKTSKIEEVFEYLRIFDFEMDEFLLMELSLMLGSKKYSIRKACAKYLLTQQKAQSVRFRLLSFISIEVCEDLRIYILKRLTAENDLAPSLMPLIHDRQAAVRYEALRLLCMIPTATKFIVDYLGELVECLTHAKQLGKVYVFSILIIVEKFPSMIKPFAQCVIERLLKSPVQTTSSMMLLAHLTMIAPEYIKIDQLVVHILANLGFHGNSKKINAAIDLLFAALESTQLIFMLHVNYPNLVLRIHELADKVENEEARKRILTIIMKIGTIQKSIIHNMKSAEVIKASLMPLELKLSGDLNDAIMYGSLYRSLNLLLDILCDDTLSTLHSTTFEPFLKVLKLHRGAMNTDKILESLQAIITTGNTTTVSLVMQNMTSLLTIFGDKMVPLLPHVVDFICDKWTKSDHVVLLPTITWLAVKLPDAFEPYAQRITQLLLQSLWVQPEKVVDEIFSCFVNFGHLLKNVDFLVIPSLLSWIEHKTDNTPIVLESLRKLREITLRCRLQLFSAEIIRCLILIKQENERLEELAVEILLCLCVELREQFLIYLPEITETFDISKHKDFQVAIQCIDIKINFTSAIIERYTLRTNKQTTGNERLLSFTNDDKPMYSLPKPNWDETEWNLWIQDVITSSPSIAISSCAQLAERISYVRTALLSYAFTFDYAIRKDGSSMFKSIITIVFTHNTPKSIVRTFLNTIDLIEIYGLKSPVKTKVLAKKAEEIGFLAQALRYYEKIFKTEIPQKVTTIESMISINQSLGQPLAALGISRLAKLSFDRNFSDRLGKWDEVLAETSDDDKDKKMCCLEKLARFKDLYEMTKESVSPYAASAAWHTRDLDRFMKITSMLEDNYYTAIYKVMNGEYEEAEAIIVKESQKKMPDIIPTISSDYDRVYDSLVYVSLLHELENVITIKKNELMASSASPEDRNVANQLISKIYQQWDERFDQLVESPMGMFDAICIRSLVISKEIIDNYYTRFLLHVSKNGPKTQLAEIAISQLDQDSNDVLFINTLFKKYEDSDGATSDLINLVTKQPTNALWNETLGEWLFKAGDLTKASQYLNKSAELDPENVKIYLTLGKVYSAIYEKTNDEKYLIKSIEDVFTGLSLNSPHSFTFALRVISILLRHGSPEIFKSFSKQMNRAPVKVWVDVLPQIMGKLDYEVIQKLVLHVGESFPNAVLYSLMVHSEQKIASELISNLKINFPKLVIDILTMSQELVRIGSSWYEKWYMGIDDASRLYVLDNETEPTVDILKPLHQMIKRPAQTLKEIEFISLVGPTLDLAESYLNDYIETKEINSFHHAWTCYVTVFKQIKPIIEAMSKLNMIDVSPFIAGLQNSEIAVPGCNNLNVVTIRSFIPIVSIIKSKQRPRKIEIFGSNGEIYPFLLKANEDTRLDERVMQLFSFINTIVQNTTIPLSKKLLITTYKVMPLTTKVGLIGWVPDCSCIYDLIRDYRNNNEIAIDTEMNTTMKIRPQYDVADARAKLQAFLVGMRSTPGDDLQKIMFRLSEDSNDWFEKRVQYTASLASTSLSGYILGLGDRHLCNIMMKTETGKLVHIDFGDCFEVAMHRKKFPERVPFRLTRMLVNCLEISGIDGTFKACCINLMNLLRSNGDQIMELLEAFIYDPLLQWTDADPASEDNRTPVEIIGRIKNKLTGNDIANLPNLEVESQIDHLIKQATSNANLALMFRGWYPWW